MNNLFIDLVQVIVDGHHIENLKISGGGAYNPNMVKKQAGEQAKEKFPNSQLAAVIIDHKEVTLEEYQREVGSSPSWFI